MTVKSAYRLKMKFEVWLGWRLGSLFLGFGRDLFECCGRGEGGVCGNFLLCVGVESSYVSILLLLLCPASIN